MPFGEEAVNGGVVGETSSGMVSGHGSVNFDVSLRCMPCRPMQVLDLSGEAVAFFIWNGLDGNKLPWMC